MSSILRSAVARRNLPNIPRWAIGVAVVTPVAAAVQGSLMLSEYRQHHGNAPHPVSPSSGVVVMKVTTSTGRWSDPPIRLLVIGDSLAAGVGVSKRGTPILPESIARALSQASGGRAVSWTCVGTSGASTGQIVRDILRLNKSEIPSLLEKQLVEWQATRVRAQEWLEERKKLKHHEQEEEEKQKGATNRIRKWWIRLRNDIRDFRHTVLQRGEEKEAVISQLMEERRLQKEQQLALPQQKKPNTVEYDIAIVLTGVNDLKDAFLSFMMRGENSTSPESKANASPDGLKGELLRVLEALRNRMNLNLPVDIFSPRGGTNHDSDEESEKQLVPRRRRRTLVVFPALPSEPIRVFQQAPLSWFLVPLLQTIDQQKKLLAECFPDLVLYVDSPSHDTITEMESGQGPFNPSRNGEQVLLAIAGVTQRAREKVEQLMKQHYQRWTKDLEEDSDDDDAAAAAAANNHRSDEPRDPFENACHDHLSASAEHRSTLVSADNIHPSDEGYDTWGRYIAATIVNELNEKDLWDVFARD